MTTTFWVILVAAILVGIVIFAIVWKKRGGYNRPWVL
jgi:hypothetical protein